MPDRHHEKPLSLRLGTERQRLEDYAREHGQPVRRVILDAVRWYLDNAQATRPRRTGKEDSEGR